ncbi:MAG: hypothetical protein FWF02_12105, partial [Micrococcales bacterium]|nr:hypothetical protein [Micrococcales bacterium]
ASALLPLLRSAVQGEILAAVYLSPDREFSVTELSALAGASLKATAHEVQRLVSVGYLADRRLGNLRLVRRPADNPVVRPLTDLLAVTYGPVPVLSDELGGLPGIDTALVFGLWAARHAGEPGPVPGDVDVLVVGTTPFDLLDEAATRAQARLHRAVNIRRVAPEYWANPNPEDTFVRAVKDRPTVPLLLSSASTRGGSDAVGAGAHDDRPDDRSR